MKDILIVAPHPDDETLGCGGTLLKHRELNNKIHWLLITNISEASGWNKATVHARQKQIDEVALKYSFESVTKLDYPTTELDSVNMSDLVDRISEIVKVIKPTTVYINFGNDVHSDHAYVFQAMYSCTKKFRYPFIDEVFCYETISETEFASPLSNQFTPNWFVDISKTFSEKIEIMKIYKSEIMSDNQPRSLAAIEALNRYRGARIGVKYAEAFMLLFKSC